MLASPADALGELRRLVMHQDADPEEKIDKCLAVVAHSAQSMRVACERHLRSGSGAAGSAAAGAGTAVVPAGAAAPLGSGAAAAVTGPVAAGGEPLLYCLCQQVWQPSL